MHAAAGTGGAERQGGPAGAAAGAARFGEQVQNIFEAVVCGQSGHPIGHACGHALEAAHGLAQVGCGPLDHPVRAHHAPVAVDAARRESAEGLLVGGLVAQLVPLS